VAGSVVLYVIPLTRRIISAITPEIKDKDKEDIENSIYESESDYIIVVSGKSNPR
jgi:hypothetical protein